MALDFTANTAQTQSGSVSLILQTLMFKSYIRNTHVPDLSLLESVCLSVKHKIKISQ